jgi:hypothetical protein
VFSELDELSGGRVGGASREAPDDVPSFSLNLHRPEDCLSCRLSLLLTCLRSEVDARTACVLPMR